MLAIVAIPFLIQAGIALAATALAYAASTLLKPKAKTPVIDTRPTTQVDRGSFIPVLVGRRRLGPVIGFVGDRRTSYSGHGGQPGPFGKGGGSHGHNHSAQSPIYSEQAWHILCVGPVAKLYAIYSNGTRIFEGPIDPTGYPAGSTVQVPNVGSFTIYWGDSAQTFAGSANSYLGDSSRVGVSSAWPGVAYVVWDMYLGSSPQWPIIEYEVEVVPTYYTSGITGKSLTGSPTFTTTDGFTGVNPAFSIYQFLFAPFPQGAALDVTDFDIASLQAIANQAVTESLPISTLVQNGDDVLGIVGTILQDLGALLSWDVQQALWTFQLVRDTGISYADFDISKTNALFDIGEQLLCDPLPELETNRSALPSDKVMFTYNDFSREYRTVTIVIDDDGQATAAETSKAARVDIPNVVNQLTAAIVAERRSQEVLANGSKLTINATRDARLLVPGQAITVFGIPGVLRLTDITFDADSGKVKLQAVSDFYSTNPNTFALPVSTGGSSSGTSVTATADHFALVEIPEYLLPANAGLVALAVPHCRGDQNTAFSDEWLSRDGTTYQQEVREYKAQTGGTLLDALPVGSFYVAQGPRFTLVGPDVSLALDLSSDLASWRAGNQLLVIDGEIFYCQKITALGGSTYRFDGLLRARYDTVQAAHSVGAFGVLFQDGGVTDIEDGSILIPQKLVYVKSQPSAGMDTQSLAAITAKTITLYGKGVRPIPPCALRTRLGSSSCQVGADAVFSWGYGTASVPYTGAGMQGAGDAAGQAPVPGSFEIRVKDLGGTLKATYTSAVPTWTYSSATRVTDLGSDTSFKLEVYVVNNGVYSDAATMTVTAY